MQKLTKNLFKHKYKILAVVYTLWMTAISLTPLDNLNLPVFSMGDKMVHFIFYFLFAILWILAYPRFKTKPVSLILFLIFWGVGIEFIQEYFIPSRSGELWDGIANTLGGVSGYYFMKYRDQV